MRVVAELKSKLYDPLAFDYGDDMEMFTVIMATATDDVVLNFNSGEQAAQYLSKCLQEIYNAREKALDKPTDS